MIELSVKPDHRCASTDSGLAATTVSLFGWPVGGEVFFLTAPFIEPPRPLLVLRASFGQNYDRLRQVKGVYDPTNLFRLNANIAP